VERHSDYSLQQNGMIVKNRAAGRKPYPQGARFERVGGDEEVLRAQRVGERLRSAIAKAQNVPSGGGATINSLKKLRGEIS
jgi:hypothetical protein